jgi:hypothetical protein
MASPFRAGPRDQVVNGVFRAEDLKLQIGGDDAEGMIVQSVQFTCNRTVNFLYEIGSAFVYYVGNRRQGQAQMSRVLGGAANFQRLVCEYGNLCEPKNLTLETTPAGSGGRLCRPTGIKYDLIDATLTSLGASVTANEIVVNEQLGFMFADIDYGC